MPLIFIMSKKQIWHGHIFVYCLCSSLFGQAHFITGKTKNGKYPEGLRAEWSVQFQCVCYAKVTARCVNFWKISLTFRWLCFWIIFKQCVLWFDLKPFIFQLCLGLCKCWLWRQRHMRRRKPHWLGLRRPAPILKPNPMSSHSACSSREFCMTCAAPRDKGRMGFCCPDGGAVGGLLQEGGRERVEI